jgi:hypothetical protein
MSWAGAKGDPGRLRGEVALLLLLSSVVVAALVIAIVDNGTVSLSGVSRAMLLVSLTMGAAALAVLTAYRVMRPRPRPGHGNAQEMAELRKNLLTAEAIIKAEPQILVFWEQGLGVRVMTHTLTGVPGLPQQHAELLKFGQWLDLASAQELKRGLDALFADGRPFSSLLKTTAGGHVEADGRAAGGRAILRLRDVAGRKRDLARILDQHRHIGVREAASVHDRFHGTFRLSRGLVQPVN